MHGRGKTGHNSESNPSGLLRDDDESSKSEAGAGNDAAGDGRTYDARPDTRQSNAISMPNLGGNVPTMRSRVTVVCAECKKQKLRCDRRIPCESCVKRNTVSRCIYTPAAIEKVDITSLNNRLRVVEGSLSALGVPTQGHLQSFPTFPLPPQLSMQHSGTTPFLNAGAPGFSPTAAYSGSLHIKPPSHQDEQSSELANVPGLNAPPPRMLAFAKDSRCPSAVAPLDGVTALWMREIVGETGHVSSTSAPTANQGSRLRHPQSAPMSTATDYDRPKVDLRPVDRDFFGTTSALGCGTDQNLDVSQLLSLHAGLGIPSSSSAHSANRSPNPADPLSGIYTLLAAQLLAQFPSRRRRREILLRLGMVLLVEGISCVPFRVFCETVESLFRPVSPEGIDRQEGSSLSSLPAFSSISEAAAGLAVGALIWASETSIGGKPHDEALRRVVCRSTEPVLDSATGHPPSPPPDGGSTSHSPMQEDELGLPTTDEAFALYRLAQLALSIHTSRHGYAAWDISLIHTRILSVHYLLVAQSTSAEFSDTLLPSEVPPLVGALIWEARGMGLGVDPDEFDLEGQAAHATLGNVMDGYGRLNAPVKREDGGRAPEWLSRGKAFSPFVKEVRRRMWWWIVWLDFLVSDAFGYNAVILPGEYSTRLPANVDDTCFRPDSVVPPPPDDDSFEKNIAPLITKFSLLDIAKRAPVRVFRSGFVPRAMDDTINSTTITAQKLTDDIVQWLDELPERFKLDSMDIDSSVITFSQLPMTSLRPPSEVEEERSAGRALLIYQQCDMAFHGYHSLIRLFTPRLPSSGIPYSARHTNSFMHSDRMSSSDRQLVGLKVIQPALAIVHAAEVQMANAPDLPRAIYHMHLLPRRLFDAAIVLAYTAIQQPLYTSPVVLEAVRTARDILSRTLNDNAGGGDASNTQETEAERVIDLLLKRAEKAKTQSTPIMAGVKRKHEDIETDSDQIDGPFRFPFMGTGIVNVQRTASPVSTSRRESTDPLMDQGEVSAGRSQPHITVSTRTNSAPRKDDIRSRIPTGTASERRERNVPAISIRQRVRDNRAKLDASRTASAPADPGFRSPSSLMLPPSSVSQPVQRAFSSGTPVSPAPSTFASEAMSASPVSAESHYDLNPGIRSQTGPMENSFLSTNSVSSGSLPFQGPRPSTVPHQYHAPSLSGPTYGPLHLPHHDQEFPLSTGSPITSPEGSVRYNPGPVHPNAPAQRVQDGARFDGARPWPSSSLGVHEQPPANLPHSIDPYSLNQHVQQGQPSSWTGSENIPSATPSQTWNMALFTNWNHDVQ